MARDPPAERKMILAVEGRKGMPRQVRHLRKTRGPATPADGRPGKSQIAYANEAVGGRTAAWPP